MYFLDTGKLLHVLLAFVLGVTSAVMLIRRRNRK